jgi:uncharacterized protein YoxC
MKGGTMLEISFVILSVAFLLLAGSLAAIFFQLWRILVRLHPTIDQLNLRLPAILRNLEEVAENVKDVSSQVHYQVTYLTRLLNQVQSWLGVIAEVEDKFKTGIMASVTHQATNVGALWKGVSTFVRTFIAGGREQKV